MLRAIPVIYSLVSCPAPYTAVQTVMTGKRIYSKENAVFISNARTGIVPFIKAHHRKMIENSMCAYKYYPYT